MDSILDSDLQKLSDQVVKYGKFWPRFGALFIDGLIVGIPTMAITYLNLITSKSIGVLIIITLASAAYKPCCEFLNGATPGKKVFDLKVVNLNLEKVSLIEVVLRNIFGISIAVISLGFSIVLYNLPGFRYVDGYNEYLAFLSKNSNVNYISWISYFIYLIDFIFLVSDDQKRALHDRIGRTYVIEMKS